MRSPTEPNDLSAMSVLTEIKQLRDTAGHLLGQLHVDRCLSELRQVTTGTRDPIKSLTGRSAMDNAIGATQELIRHIDRLAQGAPPVSNGHRPTAHDGPGGQLR
jgi:hypothetical protein